MRHEDESMKLISTSLSFSLLLCLCRFLEEPEAMANKVTPGVVASMKSSFVPARILFVAIALPSLIFRYLGKNGASKLVTFYSKMPVLGDFVRGLIVLIRLESANLP